MKKIIFVLIVFSALMPLYGSGKNETAAVRIALLPDLNSIPFAVADINGYFMDEGLDVEIEYYRSAKDRDTAFFSGSVNGVSSDLLSAAFAENSGFDIDVTSKTTGSYRIVASGSLDINSVDGLENRTIGISRNTIIEYAADRILEKRGSDPDFVRKVVIPQMPVRLQMLDEGKLDSALLPEPLASLAVSKGGKVIDMTDNLLIEPAVMIFKGDFVKKNDKLLDRFYTAYNRACEYINSTDQNEWIDSIISEIGFPPPVKGIIEIPFYPEAEVPGYPEMENVLEWLKKRDLVESSLSAEDILKSSYRVDKKGK